MVLITYATNEGSSKSAHSRSLIRASAVRTHEVWKKTKSPTKYQTSSSTGWLHMRVWRMSLRRTKNTITSWDGIRTITCFMWIFKNERKLYLKPYFYAKPKILKYEVLLASTTNAYQAIRICWHYYKKVCLVAFGIQKLRRGTIPVNVQM